jgi:hypothetical protein
MFPRAPDDEFFHDDGIILRHGLWGQGGISDGQTDDPLSAEAVFRLQFWNKCNFSRFLTFSPD